jgi:hypothetical protein
MFSLGCSPLQRFAIDCGWRRMRCRIARPGTLRFARLASSSSGHRWPCWLGPTVKLSDGCAIDASPVRIAGQRLDGLACASASPPRIAASSNQSMIDVRPGWADRHDRAGPRGERRRLHRLGVRRFFSDPASSLEVLSPSALSGRAALSEAAGLERSRFGVSCIIRPRSADL